MTGDRLETKFGADQLSVEMVQLCAIDGPIIGSTACGSLRVCAQPRRAL